MSVEVPRSRLAPALALLAEVALEPSFPADEVERLRDERINDLLQARAEPRRRVERVIRGDDLRAGRALSAAAGGHARRPCPALDRDALVARHAALMRPGRTRRSCWPATWPASTSRGLVADSLGGWAEPTAPAPARGAADPAAAPGAGGASWSSTGPGSPQSELRIGHVGVPRRTPDFHAISVLNAILGGLFRSRLNALLREEKGYTYGIHSSFDMRVGAGPFAVRTAVQTEFTVPAIDGHARASCDGSGEAPVTDEELTIARDYLVGVFPLRFETSGQVAGAIAGLVVYGLPDDELDRYRPAIAAVTADQVLAAAQTHIRPDEASVVIVGDADAFLAALRGGRPGRGPGRARGGRRARGDHGGRRPSRSSSARTPSGRTTSGRRTPDAAPVRAGHRPGPGGRARAVRRAARGHGR